jgi:hypothetical protein
VFVLLLLQQEQQHLDSFYGIPHELFMWFYLHLDDGLQSLGFARILMKLISAV